MNSCIFFDPLCVKISNKKVIIAMTMVNLVNAESMTEFFLRKIILGLYVSVVVDIIFVMNSSDKHHILTG